MVEKHKFILAATVLALILATAFIVVHTAQNQVGHNQILTAATSSQPANASSSNSFVCPPGLIAYSNQGLGIEFCYPPNVTVIDRLESWLTFSDPTGTPTASSSDDSPIPFKLMANMTSLHELFSYTVSGAVGDDICSDLYPTADQLVQGENQYGLNYGLYREDAACGTDGSGRNFTVVATGGGPFAYVDLGNQTYLLFAGNSSPRPSYVDGDLKQIVDTTKLLP